MSGCLIVVLVAVGREPKVIRAPISAPPVTSQAPSVQVEHRLVTVEPVSPDVTRSEQKTRRATQTATPAERLRRPFLARARHLLLGDGRARPEPFPRPAVR